MKRVLLILCCVLALQSCNKDNTKNETINGFDIYKAVFDVAYENIIFNNNNNGYQTGDQILMAGQYFDVKIEYVPITAEEFTEKIAGFKSRLAELNEKGAELDRQIAANLDSLQFNPAAGRN